MNNGIVLRSDKVKEGLKFDTSLEELSKRIPNTPDEYTNDYLLHIKGEED